MINRIGRRVLGSWAHLHKLATLINETAYWLVVGPFKAKGLRWRWMIRQVVQTGLEAVPIVVLISAAMGVILALQSAVQLRRVGALIYVATLVAVSIVRELGPLMTAIIVAGRSGSAFAAEIASMTVSEEVDALRTMGLPPVKFLVVPKTLGLIIALPCLTLIGDLVAILGGAGVGIFFLNLGASSYYHQTLIFLKVADVLSGLIKSVFFALIIALTGCYQGFSVTGGTEGVGRRTTSSVVTSIFLVILGDCFFTLLNYLVE
jgi:phospholipid/cholesterol/gamma-HCH transport system permease protein